MGREAKLFKNLSLIKGMDVGSFSATLPLLQGSGYVVIFLLMLVEGPIITAAASFLASQGLFNIYAIFLISFFGNFIPDMFFYGMGRAGRYTFIKKYNKYTGLKKASVEKTGNYFKKNSGKAIILFKLMPFTGILGVFSAGTARVPLKKFILIDAIFNFSSAVVFTLAGFYFGRAFGMISPHLGSVFFGMAIIFLLFWLFIVLIRKLSNKASKKLKNKIEK